MDVAGYRAREQGKAFGSEKGRVLPGRHILLISLIAGGLAAGAMACAPDWLIGQLAIECRLEEILSVVGLPVRGMERTLLAMMAAILMALGVGAWLEWMLAPRVPARTIRKITDYAGQTVPRRKPRGSFALRMRRKIIAIMSVTGETIALALPRVGRSPAAKASDAASRPVFAQTELGAPFDAIASHAIAVAPDGGQEIVDIRYAKLEAVISRMERRLGLAPYEQAGRPMARSGVSGVPAAQGESRTDGIPAIAGARRLSALG